MHRETESEEEREGRRDGFLRGGKERDRGEEEQRERVKVGAVGVGG